MEEGGKLQQCPAQLAALPGWLFPMWSVVSTALWSSLLLLKAFFHLHALCRLAALPPTIATSRMYHGVATCQAVYVSN